MRPLEYIGEGGRGGVLLGRTDRGEKVERGRVQG